MYFSMLKYEKRLKFQQGGFSSTFTAQRQLNRVCLYVGSLRTAVSPQAVVSKISLALVAIGLWRVFLLKMEACLVWMRVLVCPCVSLLSSSCVPAVLFTAAFQAHWKNQSPQNRDRWLQGNLDLLKALWPLLASCKLWKDICSSSLLLHFF